VIVVSVACLVRNWFLEEVGSVREGKAGVMALAKHMFSNDCKGAKVITRQGRVKNGEGRKSKRGFNKGGIFVRPEEKSSEEVKGSLCH